MSNNSWPPRRAGQARIASLAAKLMAEDGIADYAQAKRKAAIVLGLPDNTLLPDNSEVEEELRAYRRLFQGDEHAETLANLRQKAVAFMEIVQSFNPYLAGPVLDGTAGRYADIDIQLFTDSAKDVEIFLINRHIEYEHSRPRTERAEAVLTIHDDDVAINLVVYPSLEERMSHRTRDGKVRARARIAAVRKLLNDAAEDAG